jgi:hypothetical protein
VATVENQQVIPFIIECEAEGVPAPKYYTLLISYLIYVQANFIQFNILNFCYRYRWMKNGKNFDWQAYDDRIAQQPGRGSLIVTEPRDEDFGMFVFV